MPARSARSVAGGFFVRAMPASLRMLRSSSQVQRCHARSRRIPAPCCRVPPSPLRFCLILLRESDIKPDPVVGHCVSPYTAAPSSHDASRCRHFSLYASGRDLRERESRMLLGRILIKRVNGLHGTLMWPGQTNGDISRLTCRYAGGGMRCEAIEIIVDDAG